jgi:hypothetical protein
MRLFEFVLREDGRLNLADPAAARGWMTTQWWWPREGQEGEEVPYTSFVPEGVWAEFARNVIYLRSLASRLWGRRSKHPYPTGGPVKVIHQAADNALIHHLGMMRPTVAPKVGSGGSYWTRETFAGVALLPTRAGAGGARSPVPADAAYFADSDIFWQSVYYSVVSDFALSVCEQCGSVLGTGLTPTGRPSKRRACARCRWKKWRGHQSKEMMRARWKHHKLQERARDRRQVEGS